MATMKRVILYVLVTAASIVLISSGIAAYNSLIGITTTSTCAPAAQPDLPKPIKLACEPKIFTGSGDSVIDVWQAEDCTRATLIHDGEHNFIVWTYSANNVRQDLLVNVIGKYSGTVKWDAGAAILEVKADGAWSIKVE